MKRGNARHQVDEHLEELARLADTAAAIVVGTLTQQLDRPHPATYLGTGKVDEMRLTEAIREVFDLRPAGIIRELDLKRPIYRRSAAYGHFGRNEFRWEATDKVAALRAKLG